MDKNTASFPDHPQIALPPPFIFAGYLASALILQWLVPFPTPWTLFTRILGSVLVVIAIALVASAFSEMAKVHTTPDARQPTTALVTSGPYRFTRNPIYLGFLLIYLGFTLLDATFWGLLLGPFLIGAVTGSIIHAEETYLGNKFKDAYQDYTARVRRWL
jgi:protein-S-isoprenylcysteine O-methyltransferase Ste14